MKRDSNPNRSAIRRSHRRQVHIWLSPRQYRWLGAESIETDETMSSVVRRLVDQELSRRKRSS